MRDGTGGSGQEGGEEGALARNPLKCARMLHPWLSKEHQSCRGRGSGVQSTAPTSVQTRR
eukprot:160525-Chlamydomonas_euryale.AAC.1